MRIDHQTTIFEIIKRKTEGKDSLGNIVGEILSISQDAVYRRFRGETLLTIFELEKLCKHFEISLDSLFEINKNAVLFDFRQLNEYEFSMARYLEKIVKDLQLIKAQKNPELVITVSNIPLLQLMNFPHLVRFKLFFWAKTHLQMKEYEGKAFAYEKLPEDSFAFGHEALRLYNSIPSKEIYDSSFLRGFVDEVYYYYKAQHFEDPAYAVYMLELLGRFVDHLEAQAIIGKKFISTTEPPASGNDFEMYKNDTLNGNGATMYRTADHCGLYITHNLLNFLHTTDKVYIEDSIKVLNKQMANASVISVVNEKERNSYFSKVRNMINNMKKKIELDLEEE
jgi:hypothetical protein